MSKSWQCKFGALISSVALGIGFFFTNSAARANGCSGNTVISTSVTATQTNSSPLCDFTVTSGASISTTIGSSAVINQSQGTITEFSNSGTISSGTPSDGITGSQDTDNGAITGNNPSGLPTANMSSNPAVNPKSANITSAAVADGRAWGEIAYQRGERSGNSGGNGFNNNLYQAVFGVDAYTNAALGLKLGGGLALSNTTVNATGGNSTIQQGALFLYGKMPVAEDYVLDAMVSLGLSSTNLSRSDITGISSGFSNKSVMGNDVLVSAGLSRPFEASGVRITPYVRLTYQYVGQAAYDEGASAAALTVSRMGANGVRGVIGVGAGSLNKDPLKDEYTYRANLAIGADSQGLLNPTLNTTLGGYSSSVTTPTAGSTFVQAALYGTVKVADSAYAYAGVSVEARTGQALYGGSVGLRVAF